MQDSIQGELAVELCLRSAAPSVARGRQEAVRDRVERLESRGVVDETTVNYWSTRVCVPGSASGPADRCPRVVGEVLDAAERHGVSVQPYFRERAASHDADECVLALPVICLLVRRDGELRGVYPVTRDGERETVTDGLDRLADGADATNL
jgi:hypothetical protein